MPDGAVSLISHLLEADITKRYGCLRAGAKDIKQHHFFDGHDWTLLSQTSNVVRRTVENKKLPTEGKWSRLADMPDCREGNKYIDDTLGSGEADLFKTF